MNRPLRMITFVWGKNHIDWFERACLKSLQWPLNKAALKDAIWRIVTKPEDKDRVIELASKVGVNTIEYAEMSKQSLGQAPDMGWHMLEYLKSLMETCLFENAQVLTTPPDTIFSDGTIPNLIKLGTYGDTCVAIPHVRVTPAIFGSISDTPLTAPELVTRAMRFAHKSWIHAELGANPSCSWVGGVTWERLSKGIYSVQHRLPTVYYCTFTDADLNYFKQPHSGYYPVYGLWDHGWPSLLIKQQRLRVPGSSDAGFIVEVTKDEMNIPPLREPDMKEPDAFWVGEYHNGIHRQFSYLIREG